MRWLAFALLAGCALPAHAPDDVLTMQTQPIDAEAPLPFGSSPWRGQLVSATHSYWNGCTDHRVVDLFALVIDERPVPVIVGEKPHFLSKLEELPPNRKSACMIVTGDVVAYAHEGIAGAPAYAIEARRIEPCP